MWLLKGVAIFALLNLVSSFSDELEEAIKFCGGLSALTDGECPPQDPSVESAAAKRYFAPARNIKVCKTKDTPGIPKEINKRSWKQTKITNVKFNAFYNETSGRYGFGAGSDPYLIQIDFEAPKDVTAMVGRGVGRLVELARKESFEKDLCNPFLENPCQKIKAGGKDRCPTAKGDKIEYVATFPFTGSYYRGLPVDLRVELYATDKVQPQCVNQDNLRDDNGNLNFGEPIVCLILQGYIL